MKIDKSQLKTLWYEDEKGNRIEHDMNLVEAPENAVYQVSRFPQTLRTTHYKLVKEAEVQACKHPRKCIVPTYGWIDGIVGRECKRCNGTQTKKKWHFWPRKWNASGSREVIAFNNTWNDDKLILEMVHSGDFTLGEAIIAYATACERCMNVLAYKYLGGTEGYAEHSEEWEKARTVCDFCRAEAELNALNSIEVTDYSTVCGECEYVAADATEENIRILKAAGFSDEEIQEAADDDTIDLAILAFQYLGAKWFEPGVGFTMEAPNA